MKELMDIKRWGQSKWRMPLIYGKCIVTRLGYGYCFEAE